MSSNWSDSSAARAEAETWSVRQLKQWLGERQLSCAGLTEKSELIDLVVGNYSRPCTAPPSGEPSLPPGVQVLPFPAVPPSQDGSGDAPDPFEIFAKPEDLLKAGINLQDVFKLFAEQRRNAEPPPPRTDGSALQLSQVTDADTNRNSCLIVCRRCGCHILRAGKGLLTKHTVVLPEGQAAAPPPAAALPADGQQQVVVETQEGAEDRHTRQVTLQAKEYVDHWLVPSPNIFDNLGFCRTLTPNATEKYLTCADCEYEAIGVHYLANHPEHPHHCFLTHDRVAYLSDQIKPADQPAPAPFCSPDAAI